MKAKVASADLVPREEEKNMSSVDTEHEHDDLASLGEISLSRSGEETADTRTRSNGKSAIVDPWAQVNTNTENNEQNPPKQSWTERWGSIRSRWTSTTTANPIEDEQPAAVIQPTPPPTPPPEPPAQAQPQQGFSFFKSKAAPEIFDPTKLSAEERAALRASKMSVTVQKKRLDSKWGFGMDQAGDKVQIKVLTGTGLLKHAPFQVGDILVSVNNQKCTSAEKTIQELVKMEAGLPVTLLVETPHGNPDLVQAMVRKPSPDADLGIGFYVPAEPVEIKQEVEGGNESTPDSELTRPQVSNEASSKIAQDPTSNLLRINNIDANGLLSHSALRQGDIVMAINATPCSQMTAEEATKLLHQSDDSVTITAMKPPSQTTSRIHGWVRQLRRVGVAIGGGTMVGVGLIFIPTLPPPFGEVLIVGGVSVLGTEFEGPKRVMKSARDSLERAVGRESGNEKPVEEDTEPNPNTPETESQVEGEALASDEPQQPTNNNTKPTMTDRFKNFGRRHVLPFLDQVVGDRGEVHKESPVTQDPTAEAPETVDESNNKIDKEAPDAVVQATAVDTAALEKVESTMS